MEKIVKTPLKVDFHIHSHASHHKDGALVSSGTMENISILLDKLAENQIDSFAITDHDCFDADLYQKLKEHEGKEFKKVFPGVEFSIWFAKEQKQIHVIAIFDDSVPENIEKIKGVVGYDKDHPPAYDESTHASFTEDKFRSILLQIDVNAILIVHQKGSALPEANSSKQDLKSLGKEKMNELINVEYFDALEYKKPGRHIFQTLFAKSMNTSTYDVVKFLTGSDCHQWEHYPMHDLTMNDSEMQYSYLKCLPCFRGLVMCVTDYSRIGRSKELFPGVTNYLESIEVRSKGKEIVIPLSKGINVIVGDNSTGKSALLHKLTDYKKLDGTNGLPKTLQQSYEAFFKKSGLTVATNIHGCNEYDFFVQGEIRHRFEEGNFFEAFSKDKYPEETLAQPYVEYAQGQLDPAYESIRAKHEFDNLFADLPDLIIAEAPDNAGICSATKCPKNALRKTDSLASIISTIEKIILSYDVLIGKISDESEKKQLGAHKKYLLELKEKYQGIKNKEAFLENSLTALNIGVEDYLEEKNQLFSDAENKHRDFINGKETLSSSFPKLLALMEKQKPIDFAKTAPKKIDYNEKAYGDVKFCSRFKKNITEINEDYISSLFKGVFRDDKKNVDVLSVSESELTLMIKDVKEEKGKSGLDLLKSKINAQLLDDFSSRKVLTKNGEDCTSEYSAGFNSTMFFSLVSSDFDKKQIFMVDQPEDDISQNSISGEAIPDFKKLSGRRQVILITHNPQFVVNLDADNVIFISKEKGEICFNNGALEYKDETFDVLSTIENNLDGGEDSIKKRWRRYEKSDNKDKKTTK